MGSVIRKDKWGVNLLSELPLELKISEDGMEAYLKINPPSGGRLPTFEEIISFLTEAGVVFGIDENAIKDALENNRVGEFFLVAQGGKPEDGIDGYIDYKFDKDKDLKPVVLEDGRVDYKNLESVENVVKGQLLAVKVPPKPEKDGKTVTGKVVKAYKPKDPKMPAGKNTYLSEDGMKLFAACDGHVVYENGKVVVHPVFTRRGDVDYSIGNIEFVGDVIIMGSVLPDFKVKAGGNLEVYKLVEGGFLEAEGNIIIRGGVFGRGKSVVKAKGNIFLKFADQATLEAGGNVVSDESIINCKVVAGGSVIAKGRKGVIVGGEVYAGDVVDVTHLGSDLGVRTYVEVGIDPALKEEYAQVNNELADIQRKLKELTKGVELLKTMEEKMGSIPEEKRELYLRMTRALFQLRGQAERLKKRKEELEERMEKVKREGKIIVRGIVYPGVRITIRGVKFAVKEALREVVFYREGAEVKVGALRER